MEKNQKLINRELSWLAFNYRVLQEAKDPTVPLLERIKFIAIFSSNLDEYFKVRVATLRRLINVKKKTRSKLKQDPAEELEKILEEVGKQQREFGEIFRNSILKDLQQHQIYMLTENDLSPDQQEFVTEYYETNLKPLLHPVMLDNNLTHLFLKDQAVYLTIHLTNPKNPDLKSEQYAILEVPTKLHGSRFLKLLTQKDLRYVMFIDDVIRFCIHNLFPDYETVDAHAIKISRDAELDIEEDVSENLLAKIKKSLKKRATGYPARLLYDPASPQQLLDVLKEKTGISDSELVMGSKYHNFRDFFQFPDFNLPELKYTPQPPLPHPELEKHKSIFEAIRKEDQVIHFPYQKFDYVIKFFKEAAADPAVTAMYATFYRVADNSKIAKALLKAVKNGKMVTVVVELKARFDEESNIYWASKLERAGANVIYDVPGYKVHTKLGLVTRNENAGPVHYAFLSTGNFNEQTSYIYCDHGLFTTDPRLTKDVAQVFDFFIDQLPNKRIKHLLAAPFNLRDKLNDLVNQEIENAKAGLPAYIILKLNALQDERMIMKLYEASLAGVKIDLIIRGICCLIPGEPGLSENITLRSIIDRYLEHGRAYIFCNNGKEKMFIASADWMTRNLNRRVEVAFPVYNEKVYQQIRYIIDLQLQDNLKARDIHNNYIHDEIDPADLRSQYATYQYLKELSPAK